MSFSFPLLQALTIIFFPGREEDVGRLHFILDLVGILSLHLANELLRSLGCSGILLFATGL